MDGVEAELPISLGPIVPGIDIDDSGELIAGLAGGDADGGSMPITKRQLDKRQRVIMPEENGLDIRGFHESAETSL